MNHTIFTIRPYGENDPYYHRQIWAWSPKEAAEKYCDERNYDVVEEKSVQVLVNGEWVAFDVTPVPVPEWRASRKPTAPKETP